MGSLKGTGVIKDYKGYRLGVTKLSLGDAVLAIPQGKPWGYVIYYLYLCVQVKVK